MVLKIINFLCLFLTIAFCQLENQHYTSITDIRDDYCMDYCVDECNTTKTCYKDGNNVITDKYDIKLFYSNIKIIWKIGQVNVTYLKMLNNSGNNFFAIELRILYLIEQKREHKPIRSVHYMEALNLKKLDKYRDDRSETIFKSNPNPGDPKDYDDDRSRIIIDEQDVGVIGGPIGVSFSSSSKVNFTETLTSYLSQNMRNLTNLAIDYGKLTFGDKTFENNTQLKRLDFKEIDFENLKPDTFDNLTNIKSLKFENCNLENVTFFNSTTLQNNLELLELYEHGYKLNMKYFGTYRKLQYIKGYNVYSPKIKTNTTAIICDRISYGDERCYFNMGTNGKQCPEKCKCVHSKSLIIDCHLEGQFPELPLPIIGRTILKLPRSNLTKLPTTLNESYHNIQELCLNGNLLTNLSIEQLPRNLSILDIRENKLTALDGEVTEFMANLDKVDVSNNPWQCSCRYQKFLKYLKKKNLTEYETVLENCSGQGDYPAKCFSCKDEENLRFVVNCSNAGLTELPPVPEIDNMNLLLENNNLTHLNQSTKGFDQLRELYLRNNLLRQIDYLPSNIQYLDIRNNNITKLTENLRRFLIHKSTVTNLTLLISENPWTCDCKETSFVQFIKSLEPNIKDLANTKCNDFNLITDKVNQCISELVTNALTETTTWPFIIIILILPIASAATVVIYSILF